MLPAAPDSKEVGVADNPKLSKKVVINDWEVPFVRPLPEGSSTLAMGVVFIGSFMNDFVALATFTGNRDGVESEVDAKPVKFLPMLKTLILGVGVLLLVKVRA